MSNPIVVELTRGGLVESVHRGALAVVRANGEAVVTLGDVGRPIFPRSAVKAFQCLPVVESGTADRFGFGDRELALACASHSGTPAHAELAADMLRRAGLDVGALGCGAHAPMHDVSAHALSASGTAPSALHNNCSGKHAAMVATCACCGDPVAGYLKVEHPHQQRIARVFADFCGAGFVPDRFGIDGCSAPNWAIPLQQLARAYATFITGDGLTPDRRRACERIARGCMAAPELVAGPGRLDTAAMTALPGRIFMKTGAEGVYCGAFPNSGLAFALKIDDGNKRAAEAIVAGLIQRHLGHGDAFGALGQIRNWRGTPVGATRLAAAVLKGLDQVPVAA